MADEPLPMLREEFANVPDVVRVRCIVVARDGVPVEEVGPTSQTR